MGGGGYNGSASCLTCSSFHKHKRLLKVHYLLYRHLKYCWDLVLAAFRCIWLFGWQAPKPQRFAWPLGPVRLLQPTHHVLLCLIDTC